MDKGANGRPFAIIKEEGKESLQKDIRIAKADKAKQIVYGLVYEPDVTDAHGDSMTADEIEKAAHGFLERQNSYNIDKQHDLEADKGYVVESYIAPVDMTFGDQEIKKGSWVAGVKVTDADTWEQIEKGEITGFSMWGVGKREKIQEASSDTGNETVEKGLLHSIAKALTRIVKGEVKDKYERNKKSNDFWTAWSSFSGTVQRYNWQTDRYEFESDPEKAREAIQDFADILQEILGANDIAKALGKPPEQIAKAGKKLSAARLDKLKQAHTTITDLLAEVDDQAGDEEEEDMKPEDIQKAVAAAMAPITKQLTDLQTEVTELKKAEGGAGDEGQQTDPATAALTEAVAKALEPISKQMETLGNEVQLIKNARGSSQQQPGDPIQKNEDDSSFSGLL
ncbi:XkdF-like putative serine protease domain-containing protein [Brevibacillus porteri]|uniref:XkdF-like putative serine protease domain-containing protein n=1 Tax=Brevibacillus porteri TaxID=2126350 RepID=UPI001FC985D1|nr:XkdF-like putative serine protease domain-containing protein [Brevibacillus porteri]MED1802245.1 XkdF-like putative serine protease domain-containing protein [Brevibacillus porteri]MED2130008.1 XkdF-like putative serine protease domain-containing protein [Brevibacillus porteri]MED2745752.1 XkdF-like putative serine protease domain-containing protein [Brevibacillus porteri]MED2897361.1 XkdF-like putative serine protease domain-containing protein [Brevibacillus porteri]MED4894927.1 XkdF-like 